MITSRNELPKVLTGFEYFDLLWSEFIPNAAGYVAVLPRSADPAWATAQGLRFVASSLVERWAASDELARTPNHSTLRRVREKALGVLERQYQGQTLTLLGALVDRARQHHPKSSSAQLLTLARDGFKELVRAAFAPDGDPLEPDDHTT